MSASPLRLRFAPSPTGYLHVGGARTALFNWLLARKTGGKFLLRIEDTDKARSTDESTRAIFDGLNWLGLDWDEDVVFQGANLERHRADAQRLLTTGKAYRCFCTADELQVRRAAAEAAGGAFVYDRRCDHLAKDEIDRRVAAGMPFVVRFRVPAGDTSWDDLVHERITFPNKDIDDFVILRSDGTPIYNHAVVSDDIAMGITLVMRGDDHISNTPKQILLYEALGAALPRFGHLPMIHGTDGKKLSKRHGATAVGDYQHLGILPQAMVNFLALLGWSPGGEFEEVMTMEQLIASFSTDGLLRKASVFDPKKLEWMNGQHLARLPIAEVAARVTPLVVAAGYSTAEHLEKNAAWWHTLLELLRVRARLIDEIVPMAETYFRDAVTYDPDAVAKQWKDPAALQPLLAATRETLQGLSAWDPALMESELRALAEQKGVGTGKLFQPLRVALTGLSTSPGLFDVMLVLGKDRTLARISAAESKLATMVAGT
ncbi:MAG: glutamate--tRNA ligase [Gemmatimonadaceae bacterium]|nr:glutamate--tRNA ligase [Gemmatimonadaceae bacterium]